VAWRQDAGRATLGTAPADALAAHELSGEAARNAELLNEELRRTPKNDGLLSAQAAPTGGAGLALTDAERAAEATGIAGGVASDRPRELAAAASAVSGARDAYANFEKRALGEVETRAADQVARASDDKDHILAIAPTAGAPTRQDLAEVSRQQRPVLLRTTADTQGVPNDTPQSSPENVTNLSQDGSARGAQESLSDRLLARARRKTTRS
jgi:hypothetical protein